MDVQRIAVFGAGVMGHGIAQVAALAGYDVVMIDLDEVRTERGIANITRSLDRMVKSGRADESQRDATLRRLRTATDPTAAANSDFVIEAITENLELKQALFQELDRILPSSVVLASNTSQLPITSLAAATAHPERVCGMHFFNPPQLMQLVEIARALQTDDRTVQTVVAVAESMGKEVVLCKDAQGFITTRLIAVFLNEALRVLEEGIATPEDIDKACRLAFGHPIGPLALLDLIGLDTTLFILELLTDAYGDRFRATQTLRNLVRAGRLGRKSGEGMYNYEER